MFICQNKGVPVEGAGQALQPSEISPVLGPTASEQEVGTSLGVAVREVEWFNTRGMRRIFGTICHTGVWACALEMWLDQKRQLFIRLTSTNSETESRYFLGTGYVMDSLQGMQTRVDNDYVLPREIRILFDEYVNESSG